MKVAVDFSGLNFAVANKDDFQGELSDLGFDYVAGDKPPVIAAKDASGLKYRMAEVADAKEFMPSLKEFLTQLEAGNLEPYLKSEAVPDNSANAVKVAVAKNFDDLVMKSEKDVLVEFYAPWCGHCKKLTPVFEELGEKMADEEVEIVKMDATANDVPPQFDVKGFPTLFWLPKGSKKVTSYNGGREIDDFVKYIAENASDELKSYDRKGKEKKVERLTTLSSTSLRMLLMSSRAMTGKERRRRLSCREEGLKHFRAYRTQKPHQGLGSMKHRPHHSKLIC